MLPDEEVKMIQEVRRVHDWLFTSDTPNGETRSEKIDSILSSVQAGKITVRAGLWLASAMITLGGVVIAVQNINPFKH